MFGFVYIGSKSMYSLRNYVFFVFFVFLFFFFFDENLLKAYYMNYQHITYNCTRDTDRTDPFHHLYRPNIEISLTCTKDSNAQIDKN